MHKAQPSSMHVVGFTGLIVAEICLSVAVALPWQTTGSRPTLELEKPVYAVGESIRLWVGVTSNVDIPEALRSTCILHLLRPDGTILEQHVSWPLDGDPSHGWKGGWGFGKQQLSVGRYVAWFEFAGETTEDRAFEIVPNPFSSSIKARWVFVDTDSAAEVHAHSAVLHVENNTDKMLRFPKPGLFDSEVWLEVNEFWPLSKHAFFVPRSILLRPDEVPRFTLEKLEWSNLSRWPMVTVPAGASVDRAVPLRSTYSFRDGHEYEITIGTVLTVFVGESDDSEARLSPLRMPVSATARLRW